MIQREAWYLESDDKQLQRVLREKYNGNLEDALDIFRTYLRYGKSRDALLYLRKYMEDPNTPLWAKRDFVSLLHDRSVAEGVQDEEDPRDSGWLFEHLRERYDDVWLADAIGDELTKGRLSPEDPLVEKMWGIAKAKQILPHIPWHQVEQVPDKVLPEIPVMIFSRSEEYEEYRSLVSFFDSPQAFEFLNNGGNPEEFRTRYNRMLELRELSPWVENVRMPLKELIQTIRKEYVVRKDRFTSSFVNIEDPHWTLSVPGYIGISGPIYRWVSE